MLFLSVQAVQKLIRIEKFTTNTDTNNIFIFVDFRAHDLYQHNKISIGCATAVKPKGKKTKKLKEKIEIYAKTANFRGD